MRYFDLHCDTIYRLTDFEQRLPAGETLLQNTGHVDLQRVGSLEQYAQVFALFCGYRPIASPEDAHERLTRMLHTAKHAFSACGSRLRHCKQAADFLAAQSQRQVAAFLSIEGAELLQTESDLQAALQAGVKIVTLTWNFDSVYGCGASTDDTAGLKPAGKHLAKTLTEHGVYLDVSHLSAKGFWDLASCIDAPILATHSNSRKICNHPRNLTDEQFREIIRRGGLVGMNFYVPFVTNRRTTSCDAVVRHIEHFCELGGVHNLCIGADWDGCDRFPNGISDMTGIAQLAEALARKNYSEQQIAGFLYDNASRFVQSNF